MFSEAVIQIAIWITFVLIWIFICKIFISDQQRQNSHQLPDSFRFDESQEAISGSHSNTEGKKPKSRFRFWSKQKRNQEA